MDAVLAHKGIDKKQAELQFHIQWSDGDVTWEPWDRVKKLSAVEKYIKAFSGTGLKRLIGTANMH